MLLPRFQFRHTLEFLERGRLKLNPHVKIFSLWFDYSLRSKGVRNFIYRDVPQLQYHNPSCQFVYFINPKIGPMIRIYLNDKTDITYDASNQNASQILEFITKKLALNEFEIVQMETLSGKRSACFGVGHKMWCICERPGQIQCPSRNSSPRPHPQWNKYHK